MKCLEFDSTGEQQVHEANALSSPLRALTSNSCCGPRLRMFSVRLGHRLSAPSLVTKPSLDGLRHSPRGRPCTEKGLKPVNLLIKPTDEGYLLLVLNTMHQETTVLHLHNPEAAKLLLLPFYTQKARHREQARGRSSDKVWISSEIFLLALLCSGDNFLT